MLLVDESSGEAGDALHSLGTQHLTAAEPQSPSRVAASLEGTRRPAALHAKGVLFYHEAVLLVDVPLKSCLVLDKVERLNEAKCQQTEKEEESQQDQAEDQSLQVHRTHQSLRVDQFQDEKVNKAEGNQADVYELDTNKQVECLEVVCSHAVVDPGAVVVKAVHATIALLAVPATLGALDPADRTDVGRTVLEEKGHEVLF